MDRDHVMTPLNSRTVLTLIAVCSLLPLVASAQDAVTVGSATTNATSVDIPVYIRDMSGTALGIDQPTGSRIQSFSIDVDYSPPPAATPVPFTPPAIPAAPPLGAATAPPPTATPAGGSSIRAVLSSSTPASAPVPASVTIPAGLVSASFSINPMAIGQTTITATLPPVNGGATTQDTLSVVGPSINLAPFFSTAPVGGSSPLTLTITTPQPSDTVLTLVSSATTLATVAPTVTLPAGQSGTTFQVNGVKAADAPIQATLPQSLGGATASSNVDVSPVCITPAAPAGSAPSHTTSAPPYHVTLPALNGSPEY